MCGLGLKDRSFCYVHGLPSMQRIGNEVLNKLPMYSCHEVTCQSEQTGWFRYLFSALNSCKAKKPVLSCSSFIIVQLGQLTTLYIECIL
jgi:hypothetical protein